MQAQLGESFEFDCAIVQIDGIFNSSLRGWFTLIMATFALGHMWNGVTTLFRDVFVVIYLIIDAHVKFGGFQKLGGSKYHNILHFVNKLRNLYLCTQ